MPHGGRVLGLFGSCSTDNFFWTNPALQNVDSASEFFASSAWQNSGGDRTWLAPEVDLFFPRFPDVSFYWQPRQLDPGNYRVHRSSETLILKNRLTITLSRTQKTTELEITKSVRPALNPLRYSSVYEMPGVDYAGYSLTTSLEFATSAIDRSLQVGIWNLLQMPIGGEMSVATYSSCAPTVYMGTVDPNSLEISDRVTRFKMCGAGVKKLGFRAVCSTGRVGYCYSIGQQYALVIRNFFVDPSGDYVDAPKHQPLSTGDAIQACSVDSALGQFSELEYHVPAIGNSSDRMRCEDVSQVWAFRGPLSQIQTISRKLLLADVRELP